MIKAKRKYQRGNLRERFWRRVRKTTNCWLWTGARTGPRREYGHMRRGPATAGMVTTHRISWELHFGGIPEGLCVCHHCDNGLCVRPSHLFLGTQQHNVADMRRKGRGVNPPICKGEDHPQAKLTAGDVEMIQELRAGGCLLRQIAALFPVGITQIGRIVRGESWASIKKEKQIAE